MHCNNLSSPLLLVDGSCAHKNRLPTVAFSISLKCALQKSSHLLWELDFAAESCPVPASCFERQVCDVSGFLLCTPHNVYVLFMKAICTYIYSCSARHGVDNFNFASKSSNSKYSAPDIVCLLTLSNELSYVIN